MSSLKSQRLHLGVFGKTNVGKSAFINALTGQDVSIVSKTPGTTTDPISKLIEIPDIGPVALLDTAGINDTGELGALRIQKTEQTFDQVDFAFIMFRQNCWDSFEDTLIEEFHNRNTPVMLIHNGADEVSLAKDIEKKLSNKWNIPLIDVSSLTHLNMNQCISTLATCIKNIKKENATIIGDLVQKGDLVMLVTPVDSEAPKGRMILPQAQTLRDALDHDCLTMVCKETELDIYWNTIGIPPALVITDSQAFLRVDEAIPQGIPMTSFSILFARLKGDFSNYMKGTPSIDNLQNGDKVLILESCSHHLASDDIGRIKIPKWLSSYTGKKLEFDVVAGIDTIKWELQDYKLVVQCGGCMLTRKQVINRLKPAVDAGIPVTNYGMCIAYCLGVYPRAIKPFIGKTTI